MLRTGGAVANGRSRFDGDDFKSGRRVFREDFSVETRPLVPLSLGSFGFTDEGVPAREVTLVENGRLVTPALGLKHARRLGGRRGSWVGRRDSARVRVPHPLWRDHRQRRRWWRGNSIRRK